MIHYSLPLLGFAAYSGTGKTTLLCQLIPALTAQGLRIGVVKHAHHQFEIDYPGKDSYKLRKAGAQQMLITSRSRTAWIREFDDNRAEPRLAESLQALSPDSLDLVLVEGFKQESFAKIELHRPSLSKPLLYPADANIIAIASDQPWQNPTPPIPCLDLNDVEEMVRFVLGFCQNFKESQAT